MGAFDKHRNILEFTLSSFLRRKGKNFALLSVYALVVGVTASVMLLSGATRREARLLLKDAPEIVVQSMMAGRSELVPLEYAEKVSGIRGIRTVVPRLWGYYFDPAVGANYTLMVPPDGFEYPRGSIVIGAGMARARVAGKGDVFPFRGHDGNAVNLKVVEVMQAESELVGADLVLMGEEDFRALTGMPEGFATDLALSVRNPRELVTIAQKITEVIPSARPIIRDEVLRTYDAVFNWRSGMMVVLLSGAALAFIIFAWDRASGLSAEERREIGVLKAIGWETSDILMMKAWEGAVISLSAFFIGLIGAYIHVFFGSSILFAPALKGWSVLYPDFRLTPEVGVFEVATLFFLSVVPYTIATIVPSWKAAIMDPDSVMREG